MKAILIPACIFLLSCSNENEKSVADRLNPKKDTKLNIVPGGVLIDANAQKVLTALKRDSIGMEEAKVNLPNTLAASIINVDGTIKLATSVSPVAGHAFILRTPEKNLAKIIRNTSLETLSLKNSKSLAKTLKTLAKSKGLKYVSFATSAGILIYDLIDQDEVERLLKSSDTKATDQ